MILNNACKDAEVSATIEKEARFRECTLSLIPVLRRVDAERSLLEEEVD